MATTTNYSWTTPDDTALVKDGAAAIRSLGTAIDTTVFNNAGAAIAKTLIDAEGDLIVGDAADAVQRLAIGSNGNVLTVDTAVDGKIKWAAPAGGGKVLQVVQTDYSTETSVTGQTMTDSGLSLSITPSSATSKVLVIVNQTVYADNNGAAAGSRIQLLRGVSVVYGPEYGLISSIPSGFNFIGGTSPLTYLDSPATTSATTYKTQFNGTAAAVNAKTQWNSFPSTITLLEIGA